MDAEWPQRVFDRLASARLHLQQEWLKKKLIEYKFRLGMMKYSQTHGFPCFWLPFRAFTDDSILEEFVLQISKNCLKIEGN